MMKFYCFENTDKTNRFDSDWCTTQDGSRTQEIEDGTSPPMALTNEPSGVDLCQLRLVLSEEKFLETKLKKPSLGQNLCLLLVVKDCTDSCANRLMLSHESVLKYGVVHSKDDSGKEECG